MPARVANIYCYAMSASPPRLFVPGDGALPPALAGRSAEQAVLRRCLDDLARGAAPPHNVVLAGPRGNGKTALLNWFKTTCESAGGVDVLSLTPGEIADVGGLTDAVAPRRGIGRLLPRKVAIASVGSAEWSPSQERNFKRTLLARCRRKPLALLLDEAHTLALGVGSLLLNASQQVRAEAPFLLVLAGTPGLAAHLGAMDASFWSRLGAGLLGVGRLDPDAARAALVEPLQAHDVCIEAQALEAVVEDSQCYPYFLQLWGDALWQDHLATGASELTAETVAAARPEVATWVADYYQSRYHELRGAGLMSAAVAVAPLFLCENATASEQELDAALATAGAEDAADRFATLETLNRLGYVWCPPGQGAPMVWSAGIPSLMRYVLDHAGRSTYRP